MAYKIKLRPSFLKDSKAFKNDKKVKEAILEAIPIRKTNKLGRERRTCGLGSEDARTMQVL